MLRSLFGITSPAGARGRLCTLIFHRVLPEPDPLFPGEVHAAQFDAICGWLAAWFNTLPLDSAVQRLQAGTLPSRALAITFDDGYADNHDVAMPILRKHGLTATFFVATGFLDGGRMWNDSIIESIRRTRCPQLDAGMLGIEGLADLPLHTPAQRSAAIERLLGAIKYLPAEQRLDCVQHVAQACAAELPDDLMMRSQQVRALHTAGMQVGAHTVSHPILARLQTQQARQEIDDSRRQLQDIVGAPVTLFAYPNGKPATDYCPRDVELVRELGFTAAVSTAWGVAQRSSSPWELPRFTPWDRSKYRFGVRMLRHLVAA
jgi:peptidoglycan/xylan/chitin deacetylase (PgdA/CDA1 family)